MESTTQPMWWRVSSLGPSIIRGPRVHQLQDGGKGHSSFKLFKVDVDAKFLAYKAEEGHLGDGVPIRNALVGRRSDIALAQILKNFLETTDQSFEIRVLHIEDFLLRIYYTEISRALRR